MNRTPRILSVGQCSIDAARMGHLLRDALGAQVDAAETHEAALRLAAGPRALRYDLILVNRILSATGGPGLELIDALRGAGCSAPIMLISDLETAQHDAQRRGAIRGFGKSELDDPAVAERLRACVLAHI